MQLFPITRLPQALAGQALHYTPLLPDHSEIPRSVCKRDE